MYVSINAMNAPVGDLASEVCMRTKAKDMKAPCRTKSMGSSSMGNNKSSASLNAVPAQAIPTARQAPYRTCGLKDSASRDTNLGTLSWDLKRTNPKQITAARLTSSFTSLTATCSNLRTAELSPLLNIKKVEWGGGNERGRGLIKRNIIRIW